MRNVSESAQDAFQLGTTSGPGPTLEAFLATRFLMQYSDQARADRYAQATDPSRTGANLRSEIEAAGPGGVLINLSGEASNTMVAGGIDTTYQGHTMVATGVETAPGLVSTYFINVVDSNTPYLPGVYSEESTEGTVHAARVSHIVVGPTGQWSYESGPERLSGSISEIATTPLSVFRGPLTIGGKGGGPNLVSANVSPEVGLATSKTPTASRSRSTASSGVVAEPAATASSTSSASASFIAPLAAYSDTLASNGKPIGETWISSGLLATATGAAEKASVGFTPRALGSASARSATPKRGRRP